LVKLAEAFPSLQVICSRNAWASVLILLLSFLTLIIFVVFALALPLVDSSFSSAHSYSLQRPAYRLSHCAFFRLDVYRCRHSISIRMTVRLMVKWQEGEKE